MIPTAKQNEIQHNVLDILKIFFKSKTRFKLDSPSSTNNELTNQINCESIFKWEKKTYSFRISTMHCLVLSMKFGSPKIWFHFRDLFMIEEDNKPDWNKTIGKNSKSCVSIQIHGIYDYSCHFSNSLIPRYIDIYVDIKYPYIHARSNSGYTSWIAFILFIIILYKDNDQWEDF